MIVPHWAKMMDMRFWWLRCRASQDQFRYYWDAGSKKGADYHTKHHPDTYHEAHQSTHADIWDPVGTYTLPPIMPSHSLFRFSIFTLSFLPIIIHTLGMLLQGCVDPQIPWMDRPSQI
jgi:hypothetical protein